MKNNRLLNGGYENKYVAFIYICIVDGVYILFIK